MISGSTAQLIRWVVPFARTAASRAFSVAPTLEKGNSILAACILARLAASKIPSFSSMVAPMAFIAIRWRSTGLFPMAHPPGQVIWSFLLRANILPSKITEERILPAQGSKISHPVIFLQSKIREFPSQQVFTPSELTIFSIRSTSRIRGQP